MLSPYMGKYAKTKWSIHIDPIGALVTWLITLGLPIIENPGKIGSP